MRLLGGTADPGQAHGIVAVALVDLQRERRLGMTGIDADHRQPWKQKKWSLVHELRLLTMFIAGAEGEPAIDPSAVQKKFSNFAGKHALLGQRSALERCQRIRPPPSRIHPAKKRDWSGGLRLTGRSDLAPRPITFVVETH